MNAISRGLKLVEDGVLALSVLLGVGVSILGVFFRYVLGSSLSFVEELAGYMLFTTICIGIGAAARTGTHLRVDIIIQFIPKTKKWLNLLADLIPLAVMTILIIYAIDFISEIFRSDQRAASMHWLPLGLPLLVMPIGYVITLYRFIERLIKTIRGDIEPSKNITD